VQAIANDFSLPDWRAPLDASRAAQAIAEARTISGMFLAPLAREASKLGKPLASARERYVAFRFYPLREHVGLLLEACQALYPTRPLRSALRKLGRGAPGALLSSTVGRTGIGAAQGVPEIMQAMVKAYAINIPGSELTLAEVEANRCLVKARSLPYFIDCHHVGTFEGVLRYAGVQGEVRVRVLGSDQADYLCTWR
jgi:uncharacterized protein (TIGR02265 family)